MSVRRAVDSIFSPHGSLSRVVDRFEWRPEQTEMANAVLSALEDGESWIVEAPTGVGKSLAYLIPGALWAREEGTVLLVSTYTRNLQDQILRRDLPLMRRLTDRRIDVAVLKGRANYLCRRRWTRAVEELSGTTDGEVLVRTLEGWVQVTESGDFDEGPPVPGRLRGLLSRISSDARFCSSGGCSPDDGCFFKLSRRKARESQIVLVNHSLLVLELLAGSVGLPPWEGLVIDEAHHLPRVAAEALARRVSSRVWTVALLALGGQGEPGATDQVRRLIRGWGSKSERERIIARLREMETDLGQLLELSGRFFADLKMEEGYPGPGRRARYRLGAGSGGPFPETTYPLLNSATNLLERHRSLIRDLKSGIESDEKESLSEIERPVEMAAEVCDALTFLVEANDPGTVYWIEDRERDGAVLRSRPLELSDALGERLQTGRALVMTSATLAADRSTSFFAGQCGLTEDTKELILPPVFPIEKQVLSLAPKMIREPNEAEHTSDLAEGIQRLAIEIGRKLLVLFTAHETLRRVEEQIRGPLQDRGIWVYAQGGDASRSTLAEAFQTSERAVLLGAASFWEGVDFPGADLEVLVLVRLPFPVPTDPFVEAYSEKLREDGIDPFNSYMLPEAITRFRQGFGRLIRRKGDRGVFAILDPRVLRRGYGSRFTEALGIPAKSVGSWDELVSETEMWFRKGRRPADEEEQR